MESDIGWRWRDRRGVVHLVRMAGFGWRHGDPWYFPACRAYDPTLAWPHPRRCPLPISCITCLVLEVRET